MLRVMLLACILLPSLSGACSVKMTMECHRLADLVSDRMLAITTTFGDLAPIMPQNMQVRFMKGYHPEYRLYGGKPGYDAESNTLFLPYVITANPVPDFRAEAREYWPYYSDPMLDEQYPVVQQVDAILWNLYMQEAARRSGLTWPHADCSSPDPALRLPCEMVTTGALEFVSHVQPRIFNANLIERIWPEDYSGLTEHLWRRNDRAAMDVKRYGGLLLLQPLVRKFGVPRALAYIAQTPFQVEQNNMRLSALQFQERAMRSVM